jgi:hypothetical protein
MHRRAEFASSPGLPWIFRARIAPCALSAKPHNITSITLAYQYLTTFVYMQSFASPGAERKRAPKKADTIMASALAHELSLQNTTK